MQGFSSWYPLTRNGVEEYAPVGPSGLQVKCQSRLISYPQGKSAMLWYGYASQNAAKMLREAFGDELRSPGARGYGPLLFRISPGEDAAQQTVEYVYSRFVRNFGGPPILNSHDREGEG